MRFLALVLVLAGGCADITITGGQSGSEVTFGGECAAFSRDRVGDGRFLVGWDQTVAELRESLVRQQASFWVNAGSEPAPVSVQLVPSGDAFRLRLRDRDTGERCADAVEFDAIVQLSGAVDGAVQVALVAVEPDLAIVVEVSADAVTLPFDELHPQGTLLLSGQAEPTAVWLELAEQVGEDRRVLGEIRSD